MKSTLVEQNHLRNYNVACPPIEIAGIVVIPASNTYEIGLLVKVASRKDSALSARSEQRDRLHTF